MAEAHLEENNFQSHSLQFCFYPYFLWYLELLFLCHLLAQKATKVFLIHFFDFDNFDLFFPILLIQKVHRCKGKSSIQQTHQNLQLSLKIIHQYDFLILLALIQWSWEMKYSDQKFEIYLKTHQYFYQLSFLKIQLFYLVFLKSPQYLHFLHRFAIQFQIQPSYHFCFENFNFFLLFYLFDLLQCLKNFSFQ